MDKLYKYTALDTAQKIVETQALRVSLPRIFNDPFDALSYTSSSQEKEAENLLLNYWELNDLEDYLKAQVDMGTKYAGACNLILKGLKAFQQECKAKGEYAQNEFVTSFFNAGFSNHSSICSDQDYKILLNFDSHNNNEKQNRVEDMMKIPEWIRDMAFVCCFSQNFRSLLMWSHYSDNHKGVCIELQGPFDPSSFIRVRYRKTRPCFNTFSLLKEYLSFDPAKNEANIPLKTRVKLAKAISRKSEDWAHEKEVRYLTTSEKVTFDGNDKTCGYVGVPRPISGVYFGSRTDLNDPAVIKLIDLCNQKQIPIFQMKLSKSKYQLFARRLKAFTR